MRSNLPQPISRFFAQFPFCRSPIPTLFACVLAAATFAVQAQDNPTDPIVDPIPIVPKEEPVDPVTMTASVVPDTIAAYTDTATLSWSSTNAHSCEYDGATRSVGGSETVGPFSSSGTKSFTITCTGEGEGNFLAYTVNLTVTRAPAPVISTTLSADVLEANVDSLVVSWSTDYADYCSDSGGNSYPTSGTADLGTFTVGDHSLSFSCTGDGGTTPHTINWKALNRVSVSASVSDSTIKANGSDTVTVSWTSTDADSCDLGGTSGSMDYGPYSYSEAGSKSVTVTCENMLGSASDTANWTVMALDPTVSVSLSDYTITENSDTVDLSWTSENTDSCRYDGSMYGTDHTVEDLGPYSAGTYTFTVSCTGTAGTADGSATLTVESDEPPPPPEDPPTVDVDLNPTTVYAGTGTSTLSWTSTDTTSCTLDGLAADTNNTGVTVGPYPVGSYTFTVSCEGPGGTADDSATLTVEELDPATPTVSVSLNPEKITADADTSTLSWTSANVTSCTYDGNTVATIDSVTIGPVAEGTYTHTVSCTGPNGSASDSATLTAVPLPAVTVTAEPTTVAADTGTVELTWTSTDTMSCVYDGNTLATSGTRTVGPFPAGMHTLTVDCTGMVTGTSASDSVDITAEAGPAVTAALVPASVIPHVGESVLTWSSTDASACWLDDGTSLTTSGMLTLGPFYPGTYDIVLTCENASGVQARETLTVSSATPEARDCSFFPAAPANAVGLNWGTNNYALTGSASGSVWGGPEWYTPDSDIGTAAVHAGIVADGQSAAVSLRHWDGQSSYDSVTANGITSGSHGATDSSFKLTLIHYCIGAEAAPDAPENLTATPNPSTDGSFELTWGAPSSSMGTPATGYLAYLQGATSGPLTKTYSATSLSQSGLDNGSYTYKVFACANTEDNPNCGTAGEVTVTVAIPDNDGDGIPDGEDPDDDNDGMSDLWELSTGLDPTNSSDANWDNDSDTYTNLSEHNAGTDPNWAQSHPDQIPAVSFGFSENFIVEKGLIDGDALEDMLIRDPTPRTLPGISAFVLIKNPAGGFDLEDAGNYTISNPLTDMTSVAEVADVNGDGSRDLILVGLHNHFMGSSDWIVYGNTDQHYTIPQAHTNIPGMAAQFFHELSGWVDNANYFEDNLPRVPIVETHSFLLDAEGEIVEGENLDESQFRVECLPGALCDLVNKGDCTGFEIDCDYLTGDRNDIYGLGFVQIPSGDPNLIFGQWATNPCANGTFICEYGTSEHAISIRDAVDDPAQENVTVGIRTTFDPNTLVTVRDFTVYNPDAYALYQDYLPAIRSSGAVQPGSPAALMIAGTLEAYLGATVFDGGLSAWGQETLPNIEDHLSFSDGVGEMLNVMGYFRDAMPQRAAYREGISLDERMSSGYWDVLNGLDPCTYVENGVCNISHFPDDIRPDIRGKLDELLADLASETYASADAAARALHDSDLKELAYYLNIEVAVVIDDSTSSVRIDDFLQTQWSSEGVRTYGLEAGKPVWHFHPNGTYVWWADATVYIQNNKSFVCNLQSRDFTIYVSGRDLTKAGVRQVFNARVAGERFDYLVDSENVWQNRDDQYDFDHPDFDSEMLNIACPD